LPLTVRGAAILLAGLLLPAAGRAADASGQWLTGDRDGVIEIGPCAEGLCGRIVGMTVTHNPDGTPRADPQGRPMCGLAILRAKPDGPGHWSGRITDPETGSTWHCTLRLDAADHLLLRGYILLPVFGQTQTWTRHAGPLGAACAMPE